MIPSSNCSTRTTRDPLKFCFKTVIEGEDVEVRCNASGLPAPTIVWERLGSNLPNDALDIDGILMIPSVGAEDAGTYSCKAVNSEGQDSFSVKLEVIGTIKEKIEPKKRGDKVSRIQANQKYY